MKLTGDAPGDKAMLNSRKVPSVFRRATTTSAAEWSVTVQNLEDGFTNR